MNPRRGDRPASGDPRASSPDPPCRPIAARRLRAMAAQCVDGCHSIEAGNGRQIRQFIGDFLRMKSPAQRGFIAQHPVD